MTQNVSPSVADSLETFVERHARLFVLTGAGCSTESGIPDYRDEKGEWKRKPPVMYASFMSDSRVRARYWARSLIGWPFFQAARPNATHRALVELEQRGRVELLATQNVDRLHQLAGSHDTVDLHGRLDEVRCTDCDHRLPRAQLQLTLLQLNPEWAGLTAASAPDGDADLESMDFASFRVPDCEMCGGILKPDVVFFGETVPPARVRRCMQAVEAAEAVLVLGSSLMVYSGYRFVQAAHARGVPIAVVSLGRTRADEIVSLKIEQPCSQALAWLLPR
jgi:NAD-dependent SIR2 family protein deacetylase